MQCCGGRHKIRQQFPLHARTTGTGVVDLGVDCASSWLSPSWSVSFFLHNFSCVCLCLCVRVCVRAHLTCTCSLLLCASSCAGHVAVYLVEDTGLTLYLWFPSFWDFSFPFPSQSSRVYRSPTRVPTVALNCYLCSCGIVSGILRAVFERIDVNDSHAFKCFLACERQFR